MDLILQYSNNDYKKHLAKTLLKESMFLPINYNLPDDHNLLYTLNNFYRKGHSLAKINARIRSLVLNDKLYVYIGNVLVNHTSKSYELHVDKFDYILFLKENEDINDSILRAIRIMKYSISNILEFRNSKNDIIEMISTNLLIDKLILKYNKINKYFLNQEW